MTPVTIMSNLDSYIFSTRARTHPPRDPAVLTISMQWYDLLEKWAEKRPQQQKVTVDDHGNMKYKGIEVKVK